MPFLVRWQNPDLKAGEVWQDDDLLSVVVAGQEVGKEVAGGGEEHGVGGLVGADIVDRDI